MENKMKGKRSTINYGSIALEVFMLPDASYVFSQTQAGAAIEKDDKSFRRFIDGKSPEALQYNDFTPGEIEIDGNSNRFKSVPIKIAIAYWTYWANRGNTLAQALLAAGTEETLTRLCDNAFSITRTEAEHQQQLANNIDQNQLLFQLTNFINQQQETNRQLMARTYKLDRIEEAHNNNLGIRDVINGEVDESYPDEVSFTVYEYLQHKGINIQHAATLSKRVAQYVRCGQYGSPTKNNKNQNVYTGNQIHYLDAALRSILGI